MLSGAARAAEPLVDPKGIPGEFSANVAVVSEYFFRGISQTDDSPALQGGMDYSIELAKPVSAYIGVWGSSVDFNDGSEASVELDYYAGLNGAIGSTGLTWDAGFIYYTYPGADSDLNYDFWEVQGKLGYDFGVANVTASVNHSPENYADSGKATYYKLAFGLPLGKVDLGAYVAKQFIEKEDVFGSPDYLEWNLSASISLAGFDLSVAYTDTDITGSPDGKDGMVYFTVGRSF
jgi:uncharacterized protein (TIGR02001 family)